MTTDFARLRSLLDQLSLDEKVLLVSGASFWTTAAIDHIGLRSMVLSDGPAGVRGPVWDERDPSLSLPSGSALAASWDPDLAYRYGAVAAAEARRKHVDVVLGPTINLQRSPLGGRHFEAFSEDPLLSGELAAAYVRGMQDNGVAATPKHYVANDSETDRFTVDVIVDVRVLRELYLLPFELAVEAGAWAIMAAYNSVDGVTLTENALLESPLSDEWGFDGVVMSDWTAVRSVEAARASIDLAMPGPATAWSETLADAIRDGEVAEEALDRKVLRILHLADRVGALRGSASAVTPAAIDGHAFAREAGIAGTVLLANRNELPWAAASIGSIAVIGQHAQEPRIQGGGSATVLPDRVVTPLAGVRAALPDADVVFEVGAIVQNRLTAFPAHQITNPVSGAQGVRVTFLDEAGIETFADDRLSSALVWFDGDVPLATSRTIVAETTLLPDLDGELDLGFASTKHGRILVDGVVVIDERLELEGTDVALGLLAPPSITVPVTVRAGVPMTIRGEFSIHPDDELPTAVSMTLGVAPSERDPDALIASAVAAARNADVALVFVGTNEEVESEAVDRSSLALPGNQDDLVRAVAAVNSRTVVVVNAGSPVLLPWRNEVAGVLLGYFGGQEMGSVIADVVFGEAEPGGRLTTTWPAAISDVPVLDVVPTDGALEYSEGLHIGYRAWLASSLEPAYPFGWGLGYTTWEFGSATTDGSVQSNDLVVQVTVVNAGQRHGKQVVQVYAERSGSSVDRPARWLVGSAVVHVDAGEQTTCAIPIRSRMFAHWDTTIESWATEPGDFTLRIGSSVVDLPLLLTTSVLDEVTA